MVLLSKAMTTLKHPKRGVLSSLGSFCFQRTPAEGARPSHRWLTDEEFVSTVMRCAVSFLPVPSSCPEVWRTQNWVPSLSSWTDITIGPTVLMFTFVKNI